VRCMRFKEVLRMSKKGMVIIMYKAEKVAVIGAGFMGSSIALLCAQNGIDTINIDVSSEQLDNAQAMVARTLARLVEKEKISAQDSEDITARLAYSTKIADIGNADVVIEAVSEKIELKKKIMRQIEQFASEDAVVLSNTSGLSITDIVKDAARPERVMCAHFFSPPTIMKLIEVIRGEKTDDDTYEKTLAFAAQIGKEPVDAPELPGFIVNRLLVPMINDAAFLVMQGADKQNVDTAMKLGANHKMGPLELGDFIGLDVILAIMQTLHKGLKDDKYRPCPLIEHMVEAGKLGRKAKQGFYTY
jgi:3-hydroxybutyryl-CoA dehydrogenase